MKKERLWRIALIGVLGLNFCTSQRDTGDKVQASNQKSVVVFVCEHGSAKSTVAAAHFNKLANEQGLKLQAVARGLNPDDDVAPKAKQGLEADGLFSIVAKPQKLSVADMSGALRVVTFCDLPEDFKKNTPVEQWDNIPPVSEDYAKSRDAMVERIKPLLDKLKSTK